jgi:DNA-binding GntR family transcriptional regulator
MGLFQIAIMAIDLVEKLVAAAKASGLSDEELAQLRAKRDALNQRLAELDVPTAPPADG